MTLSSTPPRAPGVPPVVALGAAAPTPEAWSRQLGRLVAAEIRLAAARGMLTAAEGDQLLARLVLVIDQAVAPSRP